VGDHDLTSNPLTSGGDVLSVYLPLFVQRECVVLFFKKINEEGLGV